MDLEKKIKVLKTVFKASNLAFEIGEMWNTNKEVSNMQKLHKLALQELEKETPDLEIVDSLLAEMEIEADKNKFQKFKKGGA